MAVITTWCVIIFIQQQRLNSDVCVSTFAEITNRTIPIHTIHPQHQFRFPRSTPYSCPSIVQ